VKGLVDDGKIKVLAQLTASAPRSLSSGRP